ncbi:unnamed protein product, partial [marine sediment metagenome]
MRLPREACPEHYEILRYAQNDRKRGTRNDAGRIRAYIKMATIERIRAREILDSRGNPTIEV